MLTVKELREAIKDAPDHMPVVLKIDRIDVLDSDDTIPAYHAKNEFNRIVIDTP